MFLNALCGLTHACRLIILILFLNNIVATSAYYVVANSNCTSFCKGGTLEPTASSNNASCTDLEYNVTYTGVTFRQCVSCELNSDAVDPQTGQTNLGWAFYNMRFTVNQCLFNQSSATVPADQCVSRCAAIKDQIRINLSRPNATTPLDYCMDSSSFVKNAQDCAQCYSVINNQVYISNFLNTLATACRPISSPFPVESSDVFTSNPPKNFSDIERAKGGSGDGGGGISSKTKVAIAIAVPVASFLVGSFIFLLWWVNRKTSRKQHKNTRISKHSKLHTEPSTFQDSSEARRKRYESDRGRSSTDSDESGRIRISPFPARRADDRIAIPPALRVQRTPTSGRDLESASVQGDQKRKSRNSYFQKRYDVQVPNTTPNEDRSEEDYYHDYMRKTSQSPEAYPLSDHPAFANKERSDGSRRQKYTKKPPLVSSTSAGPRIPKLKYRNAPPTSGLSPTKIPQIPPFDSRAGYESNLDNAQKADPAQSARRLLSGSPFAAPSLATLTEEIQSIAPSRASRSIRTHAHTPSAASSRMYESSSTRAARPTSSSHPTHSVAGKGAEKINDPALSRAMTATPPLQRATIASASTHQTTSDATGSMNQGGSEDLDISEALAYSALMQPATTRPLSPEMYFPGESTRETVNDPALKRAMKEGTSLSKKALSQLSAEPSKGPESVEHREKVNDPALARAMISTTHTDTTLPSERLGSPALPHDKTKMKEVVNDPALLRAMPRTGSPAPPFNTQSTEHPTSSSTPGLSTVKPTQWENLAQKSAINRLDLAETDSSSSQISPMTTPMLQQSVPKKETRGDPPRPTIAPRRPSSPVSPSTVPISTQLETVSEEPRRRPLSPISPGTVLDRPGSSTDYLTEPVQPKRKRPSTPISPGTIPAAPQLESVREEPSRRPTSPVSPGTVPERSKTGMDYLMAGFQSKQKRPSTPISPGTVPGIVPADKIQDDPRQELKRRPTSPVSPGTIPSERPANPTPSASPGKSRRKRPSSPVSPRTVPTQVTRQQPQAQQSPAPASPSELPIQGRPLTRTPSSTAPRTHLIPTSAFSTTHSHPSPRTPELSRRPTSPKSPRSANPTPSRFQDAGRSPSIDSSLLLSSMGGSSQDTQASSSAGLGLGMGAALTATTARRERVIRDINVGRPATPGSPAPVRPPRGEGDRDQDRTEGGLLGRPRPNSRGRRLGEKVHVRWKGQGGN